MNDITEQKFLADIVVVTSMLANRIKYLLSGDAGDIAKTLALLNVMSNFTLISSTTQNKMAYPHLRLFQRLINELSYTELNELKGIINTVIAKIEVHTDFSH